MSCLFILLNCALPGAEIIFFAVTSLLALSSLFFFLLLSSWYIEGNGMSHRGRTKQAGHTQASLSAHHFPMCPKLKGQRTSWEESGSSNLDLQESSSLFSVLSLEWQHRHHLGLCPNCGICILTRCPEQEYTH